MEEKIVYINNEDLLNEILDFKKNGKMSEELGKMILSIAKNYSTLGNFAGYTWTDDMIGEAVLTCVKYLSNFAPKKYKTPNPFAYITTICKNSFITYIKNQNKHSKIKDDLYHNYSNVTNYDSSDYTKFKI